MKMSVFFTGFGSIPIFHPCWRIPKIRIHQEINTFTPGYSKTFKLQGLSPGGLLGSYKYIMKSAASPSSRRARTELIMIHFPPGGRFLRTSNATIYREKNPRFFSAPPKKPTTHIQCSPPSETRAESRPICPGAGPDTAP